MRYTTILDIEEFPALYKNVNCRLVFLHLTLRAEYQGNWEGLCVTSYRKLADEVGISVASVRWALKKLTSYKVIQVSVAKNVQHFSQQYYKSICVRVGKKLNKQKQLTSK